MLYQAIKFQVEKGPIDVITGNAHFSLNYEFLLDEDIEFHEVVRYYIFTGPPSLSDIQGDSQETNHLMVDQIFEQLYINTYYLCTCMMYYILRRPEGWGHVLGCLNTPFCEREVVGGC